MVECLLVYEIIAGLYGHKESLTLPCSYLGIGIYKNKPFTSLKEIMRVRYSQLRNSSFYYATTARRRIFCYKIPILVIRIFNGTIRVSRIFNGTWVFPGVLILIFFVAQHTPVAIMYRLHGGHTHDLISEFIEQCSLQRLCEEISNHIFRGAILYSYLLFSYFISDKKIANAYMPCPFST